MSVSLRPSLQEHRPPGAPEQEIFDDGEARLWDLCDLVVHFPLEVGTCVGGWGRWWGWGERSKGAMGRGGERHLGRGGTGKDRGTLHASMAAPSPALPCVRRQPDMKGRPQQEFKDIGPGKTSSTRFRKMGPETTLVASAKRLMPALRADERCATLLAERAVLIVANRMGCLPRPCRLTPHCYVLNCGGICVARRAWQRLWAPARCLGCPEQGRGDCCPVVHCALVSSGGLGRSLGLH
jgi:hypothetical protein